MIHALILLLEQPVAHGMYKLTKLKQRKNLTVFFHQCLEDVAQQPVISLGQISIIPKPEFFGHFCWDTSLTIHPPNLRDYPSRREQTGRYTQRRKAYNLDMWPPSQDAIVANESV